MTRRTARQLLNLVLVDQPPAQLDPDVAATAEDGNRWKDLDIKLKGLIEPADDVAILSYEANATRSNGEHYAALVSTGYAKRDNGWKMMFHQQTPGGEVGGVAK